MRGKSIVVSVALACIAGGMAGFAHAQSSAMSFFVTSTNAGKGADYGGLAGADKYCQTLAASAGAGGRTWRAYLSAAPEGGSQAVNARERIGNGPWQNAKGVVIAKDLNELHPTNHLTKETALTEKGDVVNGRGDSPNRHDILTWFQAGRYAHDRQRRHHVRQLDQERRGVGDRRSPRSQWHGPRRSARSWNSSHATLGCSDPLLLKTGSAGLLYCFAAN